MLCIFRQFSSLRLCTNPSRKACCSIASFLDRDSRLISVVIQGWWTSTEAVSLGTYLFCMLLIYFVKKFQISLIWVLRSNFSSMVRYYWERSLLVWAMKCIGLSFEQSACFQRNTFLVRRGFLLNQQPVDFQQQKFVVTELESIGCWGL